LIPYEGTKVASGKTPETGQKCFGCGCKHDQKNEVQQGKYIISTLLRKYLANCIENLFDIA
jgi:hypothetical protein